MHKLESKQNQSMTNKDLQQLYANNLISIKEFIKGLSLLEANSPLASSFIEALRMKALNRTKEENKTKDRTK